MNRPVTPRFESEDTIGASPSAAPCWEDLSERTASDVRERARGIALAAVALARAIGLSEPEVTDIEQAGLLHGARPYAVACGVTPARQQAALLARSVTERWDGGGFPRGLKARAIPLGARIIAVAAAYHHLMEPAWHNGTSAIDDASVELVRRAGADLDPDVVRAWLYALELRRCC